MLIFIQETPEIVSPYLAHTCYQFCADAEVKAEGSPTNRTICDKIMAAKGKFVPAGGLSVWRPPPYSRRASEKVKYARQNIEGDIEAFPPD